ncbi:MAG: glycerol-3-phosphate 1-O-acyltransferase PlsY [Clostridia bacterium]|nr:glycerol-3-phosphate 1-O-acyltransferase PlsY [Clostridia bacterium]MBO5316547.1 glycerol-3-phosphate 1-O-acyltransferase PlsY [Clostridia bacterium]
MFNLNDGLLNWLTKEVITITEEWQAALIIGVSGVLVMIVSYLLGSVNSAIIISKAMFGDDIRTHGSGNAGLTNMLRTYGKAAAGLTLLGDMLKAVLSIIFAGIIFGFGYYSGISLSDFCYVAGLFAVIGHIFPIYYGFRGGKGVLATATVALVLTPIPFLILITLFIIIVAMSKYVSLGSVCVAVLFPVVVSGYAKVFFGGSAPLIMTLCTILLAIIIVWCHRENLKRISDRTERKISFKKKDVEVQKKAEDNDNE